MDTKSAAAILGSLGGTAAWSRVAAEHRSERMAALAKRPRPGRKAGVAMPYAVALAQTYDGEHTPAECMSQPKIDGIRAVVYRGKDGSLVVQSRDGLPLRVSPDLAADMAAAMDATGAPLDGELRAGGGFTATQRAVLGHSGDAVAFHVFDCMAVGVPFRVRAGMLRGHGAVVAVETLPVGRARRDIMRRHDAYVAAGHEGLILRDASAPYLPGRRFAIQKLKAFSEFDKGTGHDLYARACVIPCVI
jgi:ATP-dependent DNA ligase